MKQHIKKILKFIFRSKYGNVKFHLVKVRNKIQKVTANLYRKYQQLKSYNLRLLPGNYKPLVSMIMTVYNRENYIREAIQSVLDQTYDNFELIIINDGSTDGTEAVVKNFADPRIKYYEKPNTGQLDTFLEASKLVTGEFIARVDSDDYIDKTFIEKFMAKMLSADYDFGYCGLYEIDEKSNIIKAVSYKEFKNYKELIKEVFYAGSTLIPDVSFWKREYFDKYVVSNYIVHNAPFYIDNVRTAKYFFINEPLYFYRLHQQNYASNLNNLKVVLSGILKTLIIIAKNYSYNEFLNLKTDNHSLAITEIARNFYHIGNKFTEGQFGNYKFSLQDNLFVPFFREALELLKIVPENKIANELISKINSYQPDQWPKQEVNQVNKVLIVSQHDPQDGKVVGGKHVHIHLLREGLKVNGVETFLVTYSNENIDFEKVEEEIKKYSSIGIKELRKSQSISFLYTHIAYSLFLREKVINYLRGNFVDCINCHDVLSTNAVLGAFEMLNLNHIPVITTLHGYFTFESHDYEGIKDIDEVYNFFLEYERYAYRNSDSIITVDSRIKSYVEEHQRVVKAIPNAIDHLRFIPVEERVVTQFREELGFKTPKVVLIPRRMYPKNGVMVAAQAAHCLVRKGFEDFIMVFLGDGIEREKVEKFLAANKLNKFVRIEGDVPHNVVDKYFKASQVVLVPSVPSNNVEEATSLAALEGMACGKVTIATGIGGLKEVIAHEENGFLVEPNNPEQIAEVLVKIFSDSELRLKIGQNAVEYITANHSYTAHAREFRNFFSQTGKAGKV
ncbi:MAG: glycosyltransferase [Clostridia bacterium]|nr:glycosyltransferase [Clostridia bacterium]